MLSLLLLALPTFDPATMPAVPSMVGVAYQVQICQTCTATAEPSDEESFGLPVCIRAFASIEPTKDGDCRQHHSLCIENSRCNYTLHYEYTVPPGGAVEADAFDTDMNINVWAWSNNTGSCVSGSGNLLEAVSCGGGGLFTVVVTNSAGATVASAQVTYDCGDPCPD